ncbi:ATP-binding cassette domain-containing protein [Gottfriedia luciferensis]|uniref:ATP-binding cassette domain-containing protein n=1 Tax=Gottfriedia luciferensis TaxID=178774 RepID=UPI000B430281|nr:ATP-binding cassette domain-containing protein [Gottfriedia luciferensis]
MTIQLENVFFSYGESEVLKDINFTIKPGNVYGLAGLNGAGKSTLMKILAKRIHPTTGKLTESDSSSIAYVPQEVDEGLVQGLSVIENLMIAINREKKKFLFSKKKSVESVQNKLAKWNLNLPYFKQVSDCSIYEKQFILIAKALLNDATYILFDEPTSSLGHAEKQQFFAFLNDLKKKGKGIVVILHSIDELIKNTDEIIILRSGEVVYHAQSFNLSTEVIIEKMSSVKFSFEKSVKESNELAFEFRNIHLSDSKPSINIKINKNQIIVIYGANGNKKTSLAKTLWGDRKQYELRIGNNSYNIKSPIQANKLGIAFVPEDRRKEGLFLNHTIRENISFNERGWINKKLEIEKSQSLIHTLSIYPKDTEKEIVHLSGGNQQKVSLAKWISPNLRCLILDEPLKGVDIYAKQHIFQYIDEFCSNGGSVIYFTNDIEEAKIIGDKIYTIVHGELLEGIQ